MIKNKIRFFIIAILFLLLVAVGCEENPQNDEPKDDEIFDIDQSKIALPKEIYNDLELVDTVNNGDKEIDVQYSFSNNEVITLEGEIYPALDEDTNVDVDCTLTYNGQNKVVKLGTSKVMSMKNIVKNSIDKINIPEIVNKDLDFVSQDGKVKIRWTTSNIDAIGRNGAVAYVSNDVSVKISATFSIKTSDDQYSETKDYNVTVKRWDASTRYEKVKGQINIPGETLYDINLVKELDYDVKCKWESNNTDVINNNGNVTRKDDDKKVTLKLTMYCDDSDEKFVQTFDVTVLKNIVVEGEVNFNNHNIINRASEMLACNMSGLVYDGSKVKLKDDALVGIYESDVYNTLDFTRIVGSFSCITTPTATCELAISVKVNNVWSKYFSYGEFGLGRNNLYYNQTDTYAYMDTDMIEPKSGYTGNGVKYRITLRRDAVTTASPELSLAALTIFMKNYTYAVDTSDLPDSVDWDVPKLYQHDVPNIGGVICSATTTTMLLKFAGYDFSDKGYQYEHQYMANMVADKGHNNPTYGNWSYNMMTAGAFGINAYVGKMYSWDEIRYYLAHNGPMGVSISGTFGIYTTAGHLIVLRGYRIENGNTTVICNDPNVKGVYYEVTLDTFLRCWGSVVYLMEFDEKIPNRIKDIY